ncbi:MAG: AbrB/MazE/SpoVT family DNA-binding domain-containing protein [Promethearchaeota archaeon]
MVESKTITINSKGMITIPVEIRKKYNMHPGLKVSIIEVNGHLELIPVVEIERLRKHDAKDFEKSIDDERAREIALENEK